MDSNDFAKKVRVALAGQELTQAELARRLDVAPTTLNSWLQERHPRPADLPSRIEVALGLAAGSLGAA